MRCRSDASGVPTHSRGRLFEALCSPELRPSGQTSPRFPAAYDSAKCAIPAAAAAITMPGEASGHFQMTPSATKAINAVSGSTKAARPSWVVTAAIRPSAAGVGTIDKSLRPGLTLGQSNDRAQHGHEHEARDKDCKRGQQRAGNAGKEVAEECGRGEDRPRCGLSDSDGIDQLLFGEPMQALDEIGVEEGVEHIAAAKAGDAQL